MKKILFLTVYILLIGCHENFDLQQTSLESSDVMTFSSHEDFQNAVEMISKMSDAEFDQWEQSKGFSSYRRVLRQAYAELDTITTAESEASFREKYCDVLRMSGSTWEPVIDILIYQSLANRDGIYKTNGYLNKIVGGTIFTAEEGTYDRLKQIGPNSSEELIRQSGIRVTHILPESRSLDARTTRSCSTYESASYFHNESNCRNDRRVHIGAKSYIALSTSYQGDLRQPRVQIEVWGTRRTGTWCNWISYSTMLHYRNVFFTLNAWTMENDVSVLKTFSATLPDTSSPNDYTMLTWDGKIGTGVLNQVITAQPFISLHAEGTSRGAHGVWVTLDCQ